MALTLNLEKSKSALSLCLQKAGILTPPKVELVFVLDVSGSFSDEHEDGVTNDLMTRLVPWGATFDPDKKMDVLTFSDGPDGVDEVGPVTPENYLGFVRNKIIEKVKGWCGATDYSYVLETALRSLGWIGTEKKAGLFGKMFGKKDEVVFGEKKRSLVIFVTDGDNSDHKRTMQVLRESEARKDEVYFLFLGISNQGSRFPFLEKIGDAFGNTGFVSIKNLRQFVQMSDDEVNNTLLGQELLDWLKR